ncbi:MAG: ankyrin repeat domain-containing protein [Sulfurovaceae bacterium]|nr:ankyrin repeat domain-containing protein [Sulfurovaceae bacterium]
MQLLAKAIEQDSIMQVKQFLDNGIDLSKTVVLGNEYDLDDPDEISVLFFAIRKHASIDMIKLLLEHGVDLFEVDKEGISSLDVAIKFKRYDVVQLCIDSGFDLNATKRKSGITPLMLASCFNDIDMLKLLLENGAKIDNKDKFGMNAIEYAQKTGQTKTAEFLESKIEQ